MTNIDFGRFDLDKPLPDDVTTNGHQQTLDEFRARPPAARSAQAMARSQRHRLCRSNWSARRTRVAARMGEVMEEVGGDGFLFSMPNVNRRTLAEVEDGLVPGVAGPRPGARRVRATRSSATICWSSELHMSVRAMPCPT